MPAMPHERMRATDAGWCLRSNRLCTRHGWRWYFVAVSRLGDGAAWYALIAAMPLLGGVEGLLAAAHLAGTGIIALSLYRWLKRWTRRPRPFMADVRIRAWIAPLDEFSFPSGHTLHAVAFSLVAIAHYPGLVWVLVPFSGSVAASRVVLGLHYPSDVAAALALGSVLASISLWMVPGASLFA